MKITPLPVKASKIQYHGNGVKRDRDGHVIEAVAEGASAAIEVATGMIGGDGGGGGGCGGGGCGGGGSG